MGAFFFSSDTDCLALQGLRADGLLVGGAASDGPTFQRVAVL